MLNSSAQGEWSSSNNRGTGDGGGIEVVISEAKVSVLRDAADAVVVVITEAELIEEKQKE